MAIGNKFRNIAGAATTTIKTGRGVLIAIVCNNAVNSGVITVYDNIAASGTKIATITHAASALQDQYFLDYFRLEFGTGLTIVTSAADDITIIYE
jgi:hypothetical protein